MAKLFGYSGKVLRVDLSNRSLQDETLDEAVVNRYVGGTGLGMKYLYDEVPPSANWCDPANRLVLASGPLGGTTFSGSGTTCVVTKGAMTNLTASTQANGFLGAFMKFCGYDALVIQGAASGWVYLHIDEQGAQLRDASSLIGKDTWEVEDAILEANPGRKYSVFGIGPAGENLIRFAAIVGDRGHVAAHNGVGAVMGSKKLKAVAIARGKSQVLLADRATFATIAKQAVAKALEDPGVGAMYKWGTAGHLSAFYAGGQLPVRNYTTNIFPEHTSVNGQYTREHFEQKKMPCWACQIDCCRMTTVTEGPYKGYVGEEPEYEGYAATTSVIGNTDPGAAVMLGNLIDRLGMDINEAGYTIGFAIECFEKGVLTKEQADGLDLRWGNVGAAADLLRKIANREGVGELLSGGVRDAAERLGGEALSIGVYTKKGNSPRGHDHRAKWDELLDTCTSNTGTIEAGTSALSLVALGIAPIQDRFNAEQVSTFNAKANGIRQFAECLGICNFNMAASLGWLDAFNAATGRQVTVDEAFRIGRGIVNRMRVYNIRCGLTPEIEAPSVRYGSIPVDGPAAGKNVGEQFAEMRRNYYRQMGWDEVTGAPKPETLKELGLEELVGDLRG